jgi:uroporphyrin-III C-methyltransferase
MKLTDPSDASGTPAAEWGAVDLREGVRAIRRGKVWLVGAGPGDPELLTLKAARVLASAEIVAYDELVSEAILALAPASAERIPVGRRARGCRHHEARIHPAVLERALAGRSVVRLKGGDPMVFGRGGEEAEELAAARIPFEIVPGISAALGAAAATHIPLTHRDASSSVTLATAHLSEGATDEEGAQFVATLPPHGTLVLYMGLGGIERTFAAMIANGRSGDTPAAAISRATQPDQRVVKGTLATLPALVRGADLPAPTLLVVGDVVTRAVESPAALAASLDVAAVSAAR